MNSHTGFRHWLVMDWAEDQGAWVQSNEKPERFLLVTRDEGRRWLPAVPPLSLPKDGFVLITFSNEEEDYLLTEENFDVDAVFGQLGRELAIWCHYGGQISLERLAGYWHGLDMLDEAVRIKLTKLLLAPYRYPMPISMSGSQELDWNNQWFDIKSSLVSYKPTGWNELKAKLNQAWDTATRKISAIAAKSSAEAWVDAVHVSASLLALLEHEEETTEQPSKEWIAHVLQEAKDSQLNRLRPQIAEELDSSNLSTEFDAVLNAVDALSVSIGQSVPSLTEEHVKSLRKSLKRFGHAYRVARGEVSS